METQDIREEVRQRYANLAVQASHDSSAKCCGSSKSTVVTEGFGASLYQKDELDSIPDKAALASLGCGNPTALAELKPGETVLDLGSGGGIDVLLSAKRVGSTGKAYGLDMTDEMLALARENQRQAGVENVEFLKGHIENIPLPDNSVDVIISNCVVNLSPDKDAVFQESYRVLKNRGRLAISDVVIRDAEPDEAPIPESVQRDLELWSGCIAGALEAQEYRNKLASAGFTNIEIEEVHRYSLQDLCHKEIVTSSGQLLTDKIASRFISAFVRAVKPGS
jgi:arsenite methyltransferase